MHSLRNKIASVVATTHQKLIADKTILPVVVSDGILVGNVLIVSDDTVKHLKQYNKWVYTNIHLNAVAIKLANLVATENTRFIANQLYEADREYARWFVDSQLLKLRYIEFDSAKDYDRAEIIWAKYFESNSKTVAAKKRAEVLASK